MELTPKNTKRLALLKWDYIVANDGLMDGLTDKHPELKGLIYRCAYCELYFHLDCKGCPIVIKGKTCTDKGHPQFEWAKKAMIEEKCKQEAIRVRGLVKSIKVDEPGCLKGINKVDIQNLNPMHEKD